MKAKKAVLCVIMVCLISGCIFGNDVKDKGIVGVWLRVALDSNRQTDGRYNLILRDDGHFTATSISMNSGTYRISGSMITFTNYDVPVVKEEVYRYVLNKDWLMLIKEDEERMEYLDYFRATE